MVMMDEEQIDDAVEAFKDEILRYIPFRYTAERDRIQSAGSLQQLMLGVQAFLDRTAPRIATDDSIIDSRNLPSAQIAVHRVFMHNLAPIMNRMRSLMDDLVLIGVEGTEE